MTNLPELLAVAFMIGLGSSGHCLLMCGGLSSALSSRLATASPWQRIGKLLLFHAGRIACYSLLGLLLGSAIHWLLSFSSTLVMAARVLAAVLIMVMGLYVAGFSSVIRLLEQQLGFVWQRLQPLAQRYMPMQHWHHALALGFLWGFLPCGMIYSTLLWAGSNNQGAYTSLLMASFGLGTLPSLLLANWFSLQTLGFLQKKHYKRAIGIMLVLFGLLSLAFIVAPHGGHQQHDDQSPATHDMHQGHMMHKPAATDPAKAAPADNQNHHNHHHTTADDN